MSETIPDRNRKIAAAVAEAIRMKIGELDDDDSDTIRDAYDDAADAAVDAAMKALADAFIRPEDYAVPEQAGEDKS